MATTNLSYYDKATMLGLDKVDYSLYQSSITNGVIGNYKDKENLLKTLIARDKKSHLLDDAILQLGKTQEILNIKTFYEKLFSAKGHSIHYCRFQLK